MYDNNPLIVIIDGQGGGVGSTLTAAIRKRYPQSHIRAIGTNEIATGAMLKAGAQEGATGENAIMFNVQKAAVVMGPIGILAANGLLGEVTPRMAEAIGSCDAVKILLPSQRCNIRLAVEPGQSMQVNLNNALRLLDEELNRLDQQ